jgi:hypothetical protein
MSFGTLALLVFGLVLLVDGQFYDIDERETVPFTDEQRLFQVQVLDAHNLYRSRHCVDSLQLDDTLNAVAQSYAQYLAINNLFEHSSIPEYGENLFEMSSTTEMKEFDGNIVCHRSMAYFALLRGLAGELLVP